MAKKSIGFLFIMLFGIVCHGQKFELGKVSVAELQEKSHPTDSTAVAAILFKKAKTFFTYTQKAGFVANHMVVCRIKIYKKEGLHLATAEVPYFVGFEDAAPETVQFSDAVTFNLEGNEIVKTKLKSEGSFKEQINNKWKKATITLPNVKVGSVIEFKYILKSENTFKFPDMKVQYDVPLNSFEYKTEIPEMYVYKAILTGNSNVQTSSERKSGSTSFDNKYGQSGALNYFQINTVYTADNIPAFYPEKFVDNPENYRGIITQELEKIRYTDKPDKDFSNTWDGVAKTIYEEKEFGPELKLSSYFLYPVTECLKGIETDLDKMNAILHHVQSRMNWDKNCGVYVDKGVKKAYESQTGNSAEINFILINMLNLAGIRANPVLVSTIENGTQAFPGRTGFNYVIAQVLIDGKPYLLDAVNKFSIPNVLPLSLINRSGRLLQPDGSSQEVYLMDIPLSKSAHSITAKLDEAGKMEGKIQNQKKDYAALSFRSANSSIGKESYLEKLENEFGGMQINNYVVENLKTNLEKPVLESFDFKLENSCDIVTGKMYLNPLLFFTSTKNPFVATERKMPIYFGYPKQEQFVVNLEIPEGYKVEILPKSLKLVDQMGVGSFSLQMKSVENKIQIIGSMEIKKVIVNESYYRDLQEFFKVMIEKQNEKIVLVKA